MKLSSYKKETYRKEEREKKHHFPMVNKKIAEMLIVYLPCNFYMGELLYHVQGVPRWRFSMIHMYLL